MRVIRNERGFTLIELVIVIVVLGILAAVAVPAYTNLQTQARTSACSGAIGALHSQAAIQIAVAPAGPKLVSVIAAGVATDGVIYTATGGPPTNTVDVDLDEDRDGAADFDCNASDTNLVAPGLAVAG